MAKKKLRDLVFEVQDPLRLLPACQTYSIFSFSKSWPVIVLHQLEGHGHQQIIVQP